MLKQILQILFPAPEHGNLTVCLESAQLKIRYPYCGVFEYDDNAKKIVAAVKYHKNRELIPFIQQEFLKHAPAKKADLLIPVPLNPLRYQERGFNQAEEFVRTYAALHGIALRSDIVYRGRNTTKLAALSPDARQKETADIFQVWENKQKELAGKRIIIADDIITTGSTVKNLADVLAKYAPESIEILGVFRPTTIRL
ncbi:hypothetical protein RDn1_250 [Candidatus Termititenax dinenymphae]|uniref:Phosphoribosyltransferase domain-containing protein n=1 Tax=Candidatus Termititenax dinenymphae TaxID=2218523 RepID=A0A388TL77_9BACT|nr:hypothetical protein RDn1_250 [Candidatus Termititenax dinenymphae]